VQQQDNVQNTRSLSNAISNTLQDIFIRIYLDETLTFMVMWSHNWAYISSQFEDPKRIGVTPLTFQVTWRHWPRWPFDSPYAISYWCPIVTEPLSSTIFEIFGHKTRAHTDTQTHIIFCHMQLHWTDNDCMLSVLCNPFSCLARISLNTLNYLSVDSVTSCSIILML